MKDLSPQDRPREKLARAGARALGDNELLAVLVGHGTPLVGALSVANHVLARAQGVHGLTRLDAHDLSDVPGVGAVIAARILAGIELGRRTLTTPAVERPRLMSPRETAAYLLPHFGAFPVERFGVLLLDARHRVIRAVLLTTGSRDASLVHPREVFREAAMASASGIIAFHNHPSGDVTPSADDFALTRRLVEAGHLMGIDFLDHVILADNIYASLKEMGRI